MSDRELLELAAKAYWGDEIDDVCSISWSETDQCIAYIHADNQDHDGQDREYLWNPLADDGDSRRLEVRLRMRVEVNEASIFVRLPQDACGVTPPEVMEYPEQDYDRDFNVLYSGHEAATRLAVLRAAAYVGRGMA